MTFKRIYLYFATGVLAAAWVTWIVEMILYGYIRV